MPTGIILLDKPKGLSSNGALQRVRKAYRAASAGHVGTLDPMATGMLPLCLDEATKVIAEIESGAKCYEFTVQLGARTDTGDAEGKIVEEQPVPVLDAAGIEAVLAAFRGVLKQVPPMYSALKREGRPLYELARQGIEVERAARTIEIRRLELTAAKSGVLELACECAKGTYIRVLGEDIARALGTCGHLTQLRRAWVEPFRDWPMFSLEAVLGGAEDGSGLLPADAALKHLPFVGIGPEQAVALRHGQAVQSATQAPAGCRVRVYEPSGAFMGLAEVKADGWLQPRRLLHT
ncbi:MAG TPA: tRNA pseudouridine(55) synthase TruB [Steroidobacteraceae bacterium]|jgi:tRNA pseudouridine55 synthase|nr:tRNA pseudouridine(55) synthase TruB [Steroidobacteraceae bacterium]